MQTLSQNQINFGYDFFFFLQHLSQNSLMMLAFILSLFLHLLNPAISDDWDSKFCFFPVCGGLSNCGPVHFSSNDVTKRYELTAGQMYGENDESEVANNLLRLFKV